MKKILMLFVIFSLANTLVEAQTKEEKKRLKEETAQKEYEATKLLIDSGSYTFQANWANTQKGRRINLQGNPTYLKMDDGNVDAYLPYFGNIQSPTIGGGGAIEFEGTVKNYKAKYNDKKKKATILFNAKNTSENFDINLSIYKSGSASLSISSNKRNSITYDGIITKTIKI